jgi:hypothetical protein
VDENEEKMDSLSSFVGRCFLHGIAFSLLFVVVALFWGFLTLFLVTIGSWLGLIVGIVFLLFLMGGLNVGLTEAIWKIAIKTGLTNIIVHGVLLFFALLLVGVPSFVVSYVSPGLTTAIIMFVIYAFIDGFVARRVALVWEDTSTSQESSGD